MTAASLWTKHRGIAYAAARDYYIPGADEDDVRQEALIGLWVASTSFDPAHGVPFPIFATMVVRRRLNTAVKLANAGKHQPLNGSARTAVDSEGDTDEIVALLPHLHQVSDQVETAEEIRRLLRAIRDELTDVERAAVLGVASGLPYSQIGPHKQTDNALQRARRKLKEAA